MPGNPPSPDRGAETTHRPHGTRAKYSVEKCRCKECRRANSEYEKRRVRLVAYGRSNLVDAAPAREHVRYLMVNGVGRRRIAELAGVAESAITALLRGKTVEKTKKGGSQKRGANGTRKVRRRPNRRISRAVEARLLAVGTSDAAPRAYVDAGPAWRMIEELVGVGLTKREIARGLGRKTPALQLGRVRMTARNRAAVERLHWKLFRERPELRALCRCPLPESVAAMLHEEPLSDARAAWEADPVAP